ncbi:MAG TPA: Ig-like domain-containing protein [Gemmatimonadaceae bacterium]|nr:Ig-like domain-containing protein [Gemmatimonadaceae bacterium]
MKTRIEVFGLALLAAACKSEDRLAPPAPVPVAAVSVVQPAIAALPVGGTLSLSAQVTDGQGVVLTRRVVKWTSSDSMQASVLAIDSYGSAAIVTGMGPGNAIITATSEGKSGGIALTILGPPAALTLSPAAQQMPMGASYALTPVVQDAAGNILAPIGLSWASSDTTIATVDSTGVVTAAGVGTATVTATIQGSVQGQFVPQLNPVSAQRSFNELERRFPAHDSAPAGPSVSATAMVTVVAGLRAGLAAANQSRNR